MKKFLATMLALVMALTLCATAWATGEDSLVKVGSTGYDTLEAAFAAATPTDGVITYEIYGKAEVNGTAGDSNDWIQVAKTGITDDFTKVRFVGKTENAEICITKGAAVLADQHYDIDVSFENLKLTKQNPVYVGDLGHSTNYFTTLLRNTSASTNTVTYTNCTFPNGSCNNDYGKTVYDSCTFANNTAGLFNLWNYGGNTEVKNCTFTGTRGVKLYNEGTATETPTVAITNTSFDGLTEKAAVVVSKPSTVTLQDVNVENSTVGVFAKDMEGATDEQVVTISGDGYGVSGVFNITSTEEPTAAVNEFNISAGTFNSNVTNYTANNAVVGKTSDTNYIVGTASLVAAATDGVNVTLLKGENVDFGTIPKGTVITTTEGTSATANGVNVSDGQVMYTVTFNVDGTTSAENVVGGNTVTKPDDPTKDGYNFNGWYLTNADGSLATTAFDFDTNSVTGNITLTAKWTAKPHKVINNVTTPTTDTTETKAESPKTFDAGVAVYGLMAVSSVLGMGVVGKKKF